MVPPGQSEDLYCEREEDIVILKEAASMPTADQAQLFTAAARLWIKHFGRPRSCACAPRVDKGVARSPKSCGEKGFNKRHREALDALADNAVAAQRHDDSLAADSWAAGPELTERQQQEVHFNVKKIRTAKAETLLAQQLTPEEITPDLVRDAEQLLGRAAKNQKELQAQRRKVRRAMQKPVVDDDIAVNVWHESGALHGPLERAARAPRRCDATVFAVADPAQAQTDTIIVAGLVGGAIVASPGGTVAFRKALATPRIVHITLAFMQERTELCSDICSLLRVLGAKWKMWTEDGQSETLPQLSKRTLIMHAPAVAVSNAWRLAEQLSAPARGAY